MSRDIDNPAGRLWVLLNRGRVEFDRPTKVTTREAWNQLLRAEGSEPLDTPSLMRRFAAVWQLPSEIRTAVSLVEDFDHEMLLGSLPAIEAALQVSFDQHWGAVTERLSDSAMDRLHFCAEYLHRQPSEASMSDEVVLALLDDVRRLIDDVAGSSLPVDTVFTILDRLRDVEEALITIRVAGPANVRRAVEATVGALALSGSPDLVEDGGTGFWTRALEVLQVIWVATTVTKQTLEVGQGVADVIQGVRELTSGH